MNESNSDVVTAEAEDGFASDDGFAPLARFKRNRLSRSQFGLMVDYMTLNPELVMGKTLAAVNSSIEEWNKKWEELTALLNADWTGAKRDSKKWRKAWSDQKNLLRMKIARREECRALTGNYMFELTELEERVLKLIDLYDNKKTSSLCNKTSILCDKMKSPSLCDKMKAPKCAEKPVPNYNPGNTNNLNTQIVQTVSPQIISPSGYIVLGVGPDNIPVSLQHVNPSPSNNVLIGLEPKNIILTGLQSSNDKPKIVEQTAISGSAATPSELNKSQNERDNQLSLNKVDSCSEMQAQVEDLREKDTSSLIHEHQPYEVSEAIENGSTSESGQKRKISEKTENVMNSSIQNSSALVKRRKLSHQSLVIRRNEITVTKLLQKQNELLEGIASTLTRIEKSVKERSSVEIQRKNNMLTNISHNIEMLAESLGTVSKSLKTIADN